MAKLVRVQINSSLLAYLLDYIPNSRCCQAKPPKQKGAPGLRAGFRDAAPNKKERLIIAQDVERLKVACIYVAQKF
jgi:hypothetical protein